jgi:acetyl esterase
MGGSPYIDPQMIPLLAAMKERMASRSTMMDISLEEMRERVTVDFAIWNEGAPALARIEDFDIPGPFGLTKVRLYDSVSSGHNLRPVLVYFHGGGWVIGDLDTEDRSLRQLAMASDCAILSVDYTLAPEHKFPDPVTDCCSAVRWVMQNGKDLGLDALRLAIGGASAGANLALATALLLRDQNELTARFLLFYYGVFSGVTDSLSYSQFGNGDYGLGQEAMEFFLSLYLEKPEDRHHPLVSSLDADMVGLPPTFLSIAGLDPLRDDSRKLAEKLRKSNIPVAVREYDGVVHGFTLMGRTLDAANLAVEDAGAALRAGLA